MPVIPVIDDDISTRAALPSRSRLGVFLAADGPSGPGLIGQASRDEAKPGARAV
jgi:hypothetical protein